MASRGVGGVYFSRGDGTWSHELVLPANAVYEVRAVWAASSEAVYACTGGNFFFRSNGAGAWSDEQAIPTTGTTGCNAIWGTGPDNVYVATATGVYRGTPAP